MWNSKAVEVNLLLVIKFSFRSQQQNRREIRMAYLTFAIVTLFFLLNLPRIALGGYEVSNTWLILRCVAKGSKYLSTLTFYRWDTISRLLMVINSSINFLIYCAGSQQFKVCTFSFTFISSHRKVSFYNLGLIVSLGGIFWYVCPSMFGELKKAFGTIWSTTARSYSN